MTQLKDRALRALTLGPLALCPLALGMAGCNLMDALSIDTKSAIQFDSPLETAVSCAAMLEVTAVARAPELSGIVGSATAQAYDTALNTAFERAEAGGRDVAAGSPLDDLDVALAYRTNARDELLRSSITSNGGASKAAAQEAMVRSMVANVKEGYAENGLSAKDILTLLTPSLEKCRTDADALA